MPDEAMAFTDIYSESYAPAYEKLYIEHPQWRLKRDFNIRVIARLLHPLGDWLDTCCGQGWHLAQFPRHRRLGLDMSGAQLERAKERNPGVSFIQADILSYEFPDRQRFALVTNLWSAYSYLNDEARIQALVEKLVRWTAPGGALYIELTAPETLEEFNDSEFAHETGTKVVLQSPRRRALAFPRSGRYSPDDESSGGVLHRPDCPPLRRRGKLGGRSIVAATHRLGEDIEVTAPSTTGWDSVLVRHCAGPNGHAERAITGRAAARPCRHRPWHGWRQGPSPA